MNEKRKKKRKRKERKKEKKDIKTSEATIYTARLVATRDK